MTTDKDTDLVSIDRIAQSILVLRERRVLLDSALAAMYGVTTKRFNEQVKRNLARFPADFAFQLSDDEAESLRSQFATLKKGRRGEHRKYLPYAFTEHGAIMAAMVLNSERAVGMSVYVVRAFVQLRSVLASDADLGRRVTKLERGHESHNDVIVGMMKAIHQLQNVPETRAIGFFELEERESKSEEGAVAEEETAFDSSGAADASELTIEERAELDQRLREFEANPDDGSPWPEIKERILKRR